MSSKHLLLTAAILLTAGLALVGFVNAANVYFQDEAGKKMTAGECPMMMEGTEFEVSDTADGVAVTVTTKTGDADKIRLHARKMTKMHEMRSESMMGDKSCAGMQQMKGMSEKMSEKMSECKSGQMMMPKAKVTVEDVPDGARLTLVPVEPSELDGLRSFVRLQAEKMKESECLMMKMGDSMMGHGEAAAAGCCAKKEAGQKKHH